MVMMMWCFDPILNYRKNGLPAIHQLQLNKTMKKTIHHTIIIVALLLANIYAIHAQTIKDAKKVGCSGEQTIDKTWSSGTEWLAEANAKNTNILLNAPLGCSQLANKPLNVVIIYVDDMGWKDLECYGSTFYETPNIDRLARKGVRFTDAYSAGNVCSPSRIALLTGKYPARTHYTNINMTPPEGRKLKDPVQNPFLELSEVTFPKIFQAAGYYTGFIGKWHMGIRDREALSRGEYGFELHDLIPTEGADDPPRILSRDEDPKEIREITDKSIAFVESAVKQNKPFLLYMAHHTVHVELQTTSELHSKYENKTPGENGQDNPYMGGMIEDLDRETGRFLEKLKELKVDRNTLIIFTSDNGGLSQQHGVLVTSQAPLRGGKGDAWEGGTRVPLIISGPKMLKNKVSSVPTIQIDLYRTLLDLAGLKEDPTHVNDGESLLPILTGKSKGNEAVFQREAIFWHYPHYKSITLPHTAIRKGDYKLIVYHEQELSPYGGNATELFNLKEDIGETRNLADDLTDVRDELYRDLCTYRKDMDAQMPEINPDYKDRKLISNLNSANIYNF
jgi:arylsulfatase A